MARRIKFMAACERSMPVIVASGVLGIGVGFFAGRKVGQMTNAAWATLGVVGVGLLASYCWGRRRAALEHKAEDEAKAAEVADMKARVRAEVRTEARSQEEPRPSPMNDVFGLFGGNGGQGVDDQ